MLPEHETASEIKRGRTRATTVRAKCNRNTTKQILIYLLPQRVKFFFPAELSRKTNTVVEYTVLVVQFLSMLYRCCKLNMVLEKVHS